MAQAVKRVSTTSLNWHKIAEKLTPTHASELNRLKGQNSQFSASVNQLPADLPKIDFADLKKKLPAHAALLDSLQKQYEAIKIPYGEIPQDYNQEINKWVEYNTARQKFHDVKASDGAIEAKKVEDKWAKAPPVAQFTREHFAEYFPKLFPDLRVKNHIPDPTNIGLNNYPLIEARFKDYKVLRRPDKEDGH